MLVRMSDAAATTAEPGPRLSRDVLIDACIRIADAEGPDAVTLRRLGSELGVDPTAVYRHFRHKEELLEATADRLLVAALEGVRSTGDWKADTRALVMHVRSIYLQHPGLAQRIATASNPLANEARLSDATLGIFRDGGFDEDEAVTAFEVTEAYTLAVSSMDAATRDESSEAWRRAFAALPADEYPHLTSAAPKLYVDPDDRFERGLDLLLDAIDAAHRR
jgi:AcrR family transcriptional regulator